jgi:tRNA 2-selenouridine synthase
MQRSTVHPHDLEVQEFADYDLVIDARSPREYAEDHIPAAVNLPVVNDTEYAEVGTLHRTDTHRAYLLGVEYSLRNIADHIRDTISRYPRRARILVYCFRGGKRSELWASALRIIGFRPDVLRGGWKKYREWVRVGLGTLPLAFEYRVLSGPTGCGKTRLLQALADEGAQVLDLEHLAGHRGSVLGAVPGVAQPSQKYFDTLLVDELRHFDVNRPIWLEAESKKIGRVQLPLPLVERMHRSPRFNVEAPMAERVRLWREDYSNLAEDPAELVRLMEPMKPLIGSQELELWRQLADSRQVDELFARVMQRHYDPLYARSTRGNYDQAPPAVEIAVTDLSKTGLAEAAARLLEAAR